jgi:hypothetical protein
MGWAYDEPYLQKRLFRLFSPHLPVPQNTSGQMFFPDSEKIFDIDLEELTTSHPTPFQIGDSLIIVTTIIRGASRWVILTCGDMIPKIDGHIKVGNLSLVASFMVISYYFL